MTTRVAILWIGELAVVLLTIFFPVQVKCHTIVEMLDQSIMAQQEALVTSPVVSAAETHASLTTETKSVSKAFLLSLFVPGAGQFYTQASCRGQLFVGTELAIWAGFLGFHLYSDWKEEDYQLYAARHAGVDIRGKSKKYFEDVSLYLSMVEYNRQQLRNFREDAQLYSEGDFWKWDSDRSRREFDSLYRASTNAEHNAVIMTGVALLNHLVSAVDAARSAKAYNRQRASRPSPVGLSLSVRPAPRSSMVVLGLRRKF